MTETVTRLEELRTDRLLTQARLAQEAGVSKEVITAIETRRPGRTFRRLTLVRLAQFFGVSVEDLLGSRTEEAS